MCDDSQLYICTYILHIPYVRTLVYMKRALLHEPVHTYIFAHTQNSHALTSRGLVMGAGAFVMILHVPKNPLPVQGETHETSVAAVTYTKENNGFRNGTIPTSTDKTVPSCVQASLGFDTPLASQLVLSL
jgi:hypothetical protein